MSASWATEVPGAHLAAPLRAHLASAGLLAGLCADVRIRAFGRTYPCHRIVLVQAGFFRAMLCGEFIEAAAVRPSVRRRRRRRRNDGHHRRSRNRRAAAAGSSARRAPPLDEAEGASDAGSSSSSSSSSSSTSSTTTSSDVSDDGAIDVHFDDPNITRAAFEYCIASLYAAAPELQLPPWAAPSGTYPLTAPFEGVYPTPLGGPQAADAAASDDDDEKSSDASAAAAAAAAAVGAGAHHVHPQADSSARGPHRHPATPRFLLSLLATSTYLIMPSVASKALTLILCSITPYTVSHYLRFALGGGIAGAAEARRRSELRQLGRGGRGDRDASPSDDDDDDDGAEDGRWDWQLEGPVWGLENLGEPTPPIRAAVANGGDVAEALRRVSIGDAVEEEEDDGGREDDDDGDVGDHEEGALRSAPSRTASFNYGAAGLKIGDSCVCWLARWGTDVLGYEEAEDERRAAEVETWMAKAAAAVAPGGIHTGRASSPSPTPASTPPPLPPLSLSCDPTWMLPLGTLPTNLAAPSTASDDVIERLPVPWLTVWSHDSLHGLTSHWVRSVISSDGFFVRSEWDRYGFARRVVELRRRQRMRVEAAHEELQQLRTLRRRRARNDVSFASESLADTESGRNVPLRHDADAPTSAFATLGVRRKSGDAGRGGARSPPHVEGAAAVKEAAAAQWGNGDGGGGGADADEAEYEQLFATGIYYTHMTFKDLSAISTHTSPSTDTSYAPLPVLQNALWAGQELKTMILSSRSHRGVRRTGSGGLAHSGGGGGGGGGGPAGLTASEDEDAADEAAMAVDDAVDVSATNIGVGGGGGNDHHANNGAPPPQPTGRASAASRQSGVPLGISSPLEDFEGIWHLAQQSAPSASPSSASPLSRSRAATPSMDLGSGARTPFGKLAAAAPSLLGGLGGSPLQLGAVGGPWALLQKRFFPVPPDDTERRGDSLSAILGRNGGAAQEQEMKAMLATTTTNPTSTSSSSSADAWGPTGLAAVREPHTLAVPTDRYASSFLSAAANANAAVAAGTAEDGRRSDDEVALFGMRGEMRTGRELAELGVRARRMGASPNSETEAGVGDVDEADALEPRADAGNASHGHGSAVGASGGGASASASASAWKPTASHWTGYEPMRIGVEFWGVDRLAEKQRLYSPSFFYGGSIWNLYVQTIRKPKGLQLGIYLHRQSPSEPLPIPSAPPPTAPAAAAAPHSPDANYAGTSSIFYASAGGATAAAAADAGASTGGTAASASFLPSAAISSQASSAQGGGGGGFGVGVGGGAESPATGGGATFGMGSRLSGAGASAAAAAAASTSLTAQISAAAAAAAHAPTTSSPSSSSSTTPTLAYRDPRKILRAFFSIHCPSPLGTALTKFSSGPDDFALSQSWGWKSSSLLGTVYLAGDATDSSEAATTTMTTTATTTAAVAPHPNDAAAAASAAPNVGGDAAGGLRAGVGGGKAPRLSTARSESATRFRCVCTIGLV